MPDDNTDAARKTEEEKCVVPVVAASNDEVAPDDLIADIARGFDHPVTHKGLF